MLEGAEAHPAEVGLEDFLEPASHVDTLLVHGQGFFRVTDQMVGLGQVKDDTGVLRGLLMLLCQQWQVQLHPYRKFRPLQALFFICFPHTVATHIQAQMLAFSLVSLQMSPFC